MYSPDEMDDIISAVERSDRVRQIILCDSPGFCLEDILEAMQEPLPELTDLRIYADFRCIPSPPEAAIPLPDSFLGGSTPRLEHLELDGVSFLRLPKLLLSATHLVYLCLKDIPHSGYFSPKAIATTLSTLTSLESLILEFRSPLSLPDQASRSPPPPTRSVLPVLKLLWFKGVGEYLEDLVARIDAPRAERLKISLFNRIVFDSPRFIQFINRTPRLDALEKAHVVFEDRAARVTLSSYTSDHQEFKLIILCDELEWQVSSLEQVCTSSLPPLSTLEDLYVYELELDEPDWKDDLENALWLELLHPFSTVKNLYLSEKLAGHIVPALQELVGGRTAEVLPILEKIFFEGLKSSGPIRDFQEGIGQFLAARQVAGHPIAVSHWADSKKGKTRELFYD